ncbi:MAG TPA: FCD domain-containing protein [Rhodocyclaceae bacterium]|nr:FCD domain-containing protein [Rhodocyclaceae bacterium]
MTDTGPKETLIEVAIERLSTDIVAGTLAPEQKLQIAELKERYQIGASPLREALSKLSSLGFVVFDSRRGFRVAPVSRADLEDLTQVRKLVETEGLRLSIAAGNDEWDVGIVAATARLRRLGDRNKSGEEVPLGEVERVHRQFHLALVSGCNSRRLATLQELFYDQAQRYRSVLLREGPPIDEFVDVHVQLAADVLSRNVDQACTALAAHIELTLTGVCPPEG